MRTPPVTRQRAYVILVVFGLVPSLRADTPSASYIFPAGGQRGTTVEFRVGAHFLHGSSPFEMRGHGIDADSRIEETETTWFEGPMILKPVSQGSENYPKDHRGTVRIAENAEPGVRYWRLWTSQGAIDSRQFVVGHLPEVIENEIDGLPIPEHISLPVTINGRIFPREDVDLWTFDAKAGESITCEVNASRIGSPLDSRIEIRGPDGRRIAENIDHFGTDSFVRFTAPHDGTYELQIHDINFAGLQDYVYRLTVTNGPWVDYVYPPGGQRGSIVSLDLSGQHVDNEVVNVQIPDDADGPWLHEIRTRAGLSNPVVLLSSDLPEVVEPDDGSRPVLAVPSTVNGRIARPGQIDDWLASGTAGEKYVVHLRSSRFGSPLDASVSIVDSGDKVIASQASTEDKPVEPRVEFTVPGDGVFRIRVSDYDTSRGGPEYIYRMTIDRLSSPDFEIRLPSDAITLTRESQAKFKVTAIRRNGFKGPVTIEAEGLPDGVAIEQNTIADGKNDTQLVLKATARTKIDVHHVRFYGVSGEGDQRIRHPAAVTAPFGQPERSDVLVSVAMPTPFKVDGIAFRTSYGARGTVFRRHYRLDRGGFTGPLTVSLADRQIRHLQGVTGPTLQLGGSETDFDYPLRIPTWLEMNRTSRTVVMAVGEVEDFDGTRHMVSYSSGVPKDQIILLTAPCPLSIRCRRSSERAIPGQTVDLPFEIARGVLKPAPVTVELIVPKHIRGVVAKPVTIGPDQLDAALPVTFSAPCGPFNMPLTLRATTTSDGDTVIAETKVEFVEARPVEK